MDRVDLLVLYPAQRDGHKRLVSKVRIKCTRALYLNLVHVSAWLPFHALCAALGGTALGGTALGGTALDGSTLRGSTNRLQDSIFRIPREDVDAGSEVLCTQVVGHTRSRRPRPRA